MNFMTRTRVYIITRISNSSNEEYTKETDEQLRSRVVQLNELGSMLLGEIVLCMGGLCQVGRLSWMSGGCGVAANAKTFWANSLPICVVACRLSSNTEKSTQNFNKQKGITNEGFLDPKPYARVKPGMLSLKQIGKNDKKTCGECGSNT